MKSDNETTLSERLYHELYDDITQQRLVSGQKLTLNMLKDRFNVSHTPIREALSRLVSDGLVTHSTNRGMTVAEFSPAEIREMFQFTAELEATAVKMCSTGFATAPMESELKQAIDQEKAALENYPSNESIEAFSIVGGQIHDIFYKYANNRFLSEAANRLAARMELMSSIYATQDNYPQIYENHLRIYEAICHRDFDQAADLVRAHLQFSLMRTLENLESTSLR